MTSKAARLIDSIIEPLGEMDVKSVADIVKKIGGKYLGSAMIDDDDAYGKRKAEQFLLPKNEAIAFEKALQDLDFSYKAGRRGDGSVLFYVFV